jgi:hypothetical protein
MEEVYNVKPEERDSIGTNPSTRLFIVVVLVSRKGNFQDRRVN